MPGSARPLCENDDRQVRREGLCRSCLKLLDAGVPRSKLGALARRMKSPAGAVVVSTRVPADTLEKLAKVASARGIVPYQLVHDLLVQWARRQGGE